MEYTFKGYVKSIEQESKNKIKCLIKFRYIAIEGFDKNSYFAISNDKKSILELKEDDSFEIEDNMLNIILSGASSNNEFIVTFEDKKIKSDTNNDEEMNCYKIAKVEIIYD